MNSELRAKINDIIYLGTTARRTESLVLTDRILALLTPPATAKLPDGVVVCAMPDGRYHVRGCGWWLLKQGRWEKMTLPTHEYPGEFVSHDDALTAALSAPPVPAKLPDDRYGGDASRPLDASSPNHFGDATELVKARALTAALSAPPVPGESKPTPTHDDYHALKFCLAREQDESAALRKVRDFLNARIAELEAEVANMRGVVRVATKLRDEGGKNLGTVDELHYALASLGLHTPAEKPDARKVAPNGRAMVEWRRVDDAHVIGRDDSCQWWYWLYGEMSWEPCRIDPELFKPCTFDGTPITESKPDPLDRAVTVGDMLRLAGNLRKSDFYFLANHIDRVFKPQGAEHVE